jgi:hypothetical protein
VSSSECFLSGFPLLIAGTLDYLKTVNEELVSKFKDPLVIYHEGNHKVPRLGKYKCDCSPSVNYSLSYVYALIGLGTYNQLGSAFPEMRRSGMVSVKFEGFIKAEVICKLCFYGWLI